MLPKIPHPYRALIDPLDEGRSRRNLIQRVMSDLEVIRESLADDKTHRLLGPLGMLLQKRSQPGRQGAVKLRHSAYVITPDLQSG